MTIRAEMRRRSTVSTWTKPAVRMPRACVVRNCFQAGAGAAGRRAGPGIMQDVPHPWRQRSGGRAGRARLARGGAPRWDCRWRCGSRACGSRLPCAAIQGADGWCSPHVRVTRRRCQASSVPGVTANTSPHRRPGDQPPQRREPQPAGQLKADPAGLAAQHSPAAAPAVPLPCTPGTGPAASGR